MLVKYTNILMILALLIIGTGNIFWGERIPVANGLGWDGNFHGDLAKGWADKAFVKKEFYNLRTGYTYKISTYNIQRIFPSGVVHYGMRLLRVPLETKNIIKGFLVYNLILLMLIAFCWGLVSDHLKISCRGKWLGFTGLFINFALTFNLYYPTLTDVTAFAIGMLLTTFYIFNRPTCILIATIAGAFTWPTMIYVGIPLYIFSINKAEPRPAAFKLNVYFAAFSAAVMLFGAIYVKYFLGFSWGSAQMPSLLPLSILAVVAYIFFALKSLLNDSRLFKIRYLYNNLSKKRLLTIIITFIVINLLISFMDLPISNNPLSRLLKAMVAISVAKPFIFSLAHVLYFGPLFLFAFILWKDISKIAREFGIGLTLILLLSIPLSISSESRQIINFLPLFLILIVKASEKYNWRPMFYWLIAILSFGSSKLWLKFNTKGMSINDPFRFQEFPWQKFFSSIGYQMSNSMYLIQGAMVLLTAIILYLLHCRYHDQYKRPTKG